MPGARCGRASRQRRSSRGRRSSCTRRCAKFSVGEQRHLFTPRDLTQWIVGLARYDLNEAAPACSTCGRPRGRSNCARAWSRRSTAKFDALVRATLKGHFGYTQDDKQPGALYSALMMAAADRAGAAPDRALTLKRASAAEVEKVVAVGLKAYEREVKEPGLLLSRDPRSHAPHSHIPHLQVKELGLLLFPSAPRSLPWTACSRAPAAAPPRRRVRRRLPLAALARVPSPASSCVPVVVRDYSLRSFCAELKVALPRRA